MKEVTKCRKRTENMLEEIIEKFNMRSKKFLYKICMEIYVQMYKEADPPLDFEQAIKDGITTKENWFMNYYLSTKRQEEIIVEIEEKYKCSREERRKIDGEIWLGCSPTGVK